MYEWFTRITDIWPTFFVNGAVVYFHERFLMPMMAGMFGYMGSYTAAGMTFAMQKTATETSYFQGKGFGLGSLFSGEPSGASGTGMQ
jgi:hypothetical protein